MARDSWSQEHHQSALTERQARYWARRIGSTATIHEICTGDRMWDCGWDSGYYLRVPVGRGATQTLCTRVQLRNYAETGV